MIPAQITRAMAQSAHDRALGAVVSFEREDLGEYYAGNHARHSEFYDGDVDLVGLLGWAIPARPVDRGDGTAFTLVDWPGCAGAPRRREGIPASVTRGLLMHAWLHAEGASASLHPGEHDVRISFTGWCAEERCFSAGLMDLSAHVDHRDVVGLVGWAVPARPSYSGSGVVRLSRLPAAGGVS